MNMELVSGFLLWIADVVGIKWVRQEKNQFKKTVKAVTFFIVGIIFIMIFFVVWYA